MPRGVALPMREVEDRATPQRIYEFGDKIAQKLQADNKAKQEAYERSGKISGGKLGKPTLWVVLDMLGVPDETDPYLLGKFQRGNDVEARAINFLTGIEADKVEPGIVVESVEGAILQGKFILQKLGGYRGGVGFIDLAQVLTNGQVYHEIKSSSKLAYDKVAASGGTAAAAKRRGQVAVPEPYYHHELQLAYYCLGDAVHSAFLHYFNADDYRLCTFSINPLDYKAEIDREIDDIEAVFALKQLPPFEGFLPWHKLRNYWSYKEWNELSPQQMMDKLRGEFPESYRKLMGEV